jgi:phosphoribosyl 1,2-cyclic phosphodiesterase
MQFISLNSGSNANATLVISNQQVILIDVGLPYGDLTSRINACGYAWEDIKAVLITHEHSDHIKALPYIRPDLIYASSGTTKVFPLNVLVPYERRLIAGFDVLPIPNSHDAKNPLGFVISDGEETLVYVTDTGYVHEDHVNVMRNAHYYFFESNYDVRLLVSSKRPQMLKDRIMSPLGHLSNSESALLLSRMIGPNTKKVVLAHISEEANRPELAVQTVHDILADQGIAHDHIEIIAASRYGITKGN